MKKMMLWLMIFLVVSLVPAGALSEVKILLDDKEDVFFLESVGVVGDNYLTQGFGRYQVSDEDLTVLDNAGIQYEIVIDDVSRNLNRASSAEIYQKMNALVANFPSICTKVVYGASATDNKELCAIKISDNVATDEAEPEILFDGGIHGNEYAGPDLMVRFAEFLCNAYGSNAEVTNLVDNREIWFYCMVNPDGRDRGTRGTPKSSDLNRTWGYMKRGFDQPEVRAIRDCLLENQFVMQLTYHTGIEYLLFPWCHTSSATPEKSIHKKIADLYSVTSGYYNPSKNVQSYADYPTTGETIDYSYGALGILALTMEITNGSNLTDSLYRYNEPAMLKMIEYAGYGVSGVITDSVSGKPVGASVTVNDHYPITSDPGVGDYHKYLPAGNYSITVSANGYHSKTINNVVVNENDMAVVNVALDRDFAGKAYAHRVVYAESGSGKTPDVLGEPDGNGYSGLVVVDMLVGITDVPGNEITLHGGSASVSVGESVDGPWQSLGSGTSFDLSQAGVASARYFRVDGQNFDALEAVYDYAFSTPTPTPTPTPTAPPLSNLALAGKAVSSSDYSPMYTAVNVNDGAESSVWGGAVSDSEPYVYVDLGSVYTIKKIVVKWYDAYYASDYLLAAQIDGQWVSVPVSSDGGVDVFEIAADNITSRYVGLQCLGGPFGAYGIRELEVWGR